MSNRLRFVIPGVILVAASALLAALLLGSSTLAAGQRTRLPIYGVKVVAKYPHDPKAFSQGLVIKGDVLLEGTGQYGESTLREVDLKTGRVREVELKAGKVKRLVRLHESVFGEGITVMGDKIYQLTWQKGLAYVYDRESMKYEKLFRYEGEGWGLTHDGKHLIMSDGTATLRFIDPTNFRVKKVIRVTRDAGKAVTDLNELEYINGEIFANIWHSNMIARIDPTTGKIKSWLDLKPLVPAAVRFDAEAVLNGIAWDAAHKRLFVTGKDWPVLYQIKINDRPK